MDAVTRESGLSGEEVANPPRSSGFWARTFRRGGPENMSPGQYFAYGLPRVPVEAMITPLGMFLAPFFTGELGITLTSWALIALIARIVDLTSDPFVGLICDRFGSRWGRRRHWMVIATPMVMAACAMLFTPQYFTSHPTFWYVLLGTLLFNLGTTIQGLNHTAWGGELTSSYGERSRVLGWRSGLGAVARLMAFGIPAAMEWVVPGATMGDKLKALMWTTVILMPITTFVALALVPERRGDEIPEHERHTATIGEMLATLKRMLTNKYLGWILLVDVLQAGPTAVKAALFVFYVSYVMQAPGLVATLLLAVFGATVISTPIWMRLARGREKHRLLSISVLIYGCSQASMLFWGPNELFFFMCAIAINGAMNAGPEFLMKSIMVDIVDYDTVKSGGTKQQSGTYFAVLETTAKLAPSLALMAIFPMLQSIGFDPSGKNNTPESIEAVRITFALAPTIPVLLASLLLWRFPLGSQQQAELRAELEARVRRKAGGA